MLLFGDLTLARRYSSEITQRELPNEYQHGGVIMFFKNLCVFVLWTKVALSFEGLMPLSQFLPGRYNVCLWFLPTD